jgi:beta-glucanase (GH16 family)
MYRLLTILALLPSAVAVEPATADGWRLVWSDEFNQDGAPDPAKWTFENGFVRNEELQWYQPQNAVVQGGHLVIEARRERVPNPGYRKDAKDWRGKREFAEYTSACVITKGLHQWTYGRFEVRARIDVQKGMWPAIWTLGVEREWPSNGEIDIMEFYRVKDVPTILANACWGSGKRWDAVWNAKKIPFSHFTAKDPDWAKGFHTWRMDWDEQQVRLLLDGELLNTIDVAKARNPDGFLPFRQPHYLLLNLAIGKAGGDPTASTFPARYEIDFVRVYQR